MVVAGRGGLWLARRVVAGFGGLWLASDGWMAGLTWVAGVSWMAGWNKRSSRVRPRSEEFEITQMQTEILVTLRNVSAIAHLSTSLRTMRFFQLSREPSHMHKICAVDALATGLQASAMPDSTRIDGRRNGRTRLHREALGHRSWRPVTSAAVRHAVRRSMSSCG